MRDSVHWTLIQAFNFAFQLHREVCRYVGDSYLADFGMQLVSRGLDVIHQWKELVAFMKPQPSPHIPLWASHAFNFIHFLTDPKYTEYLLDYQFQVLKADVEECKRLVLGDKDAITVTPRSRSSTMSSRKTSDDISSKMKKVSLESRRARLEAAALETDAKVAKRILKGEVDIFRNLNHKNLVKYYGCEVRQDEVLIMMEYCSEGTLERICREGLDEELVRRYTNSLLRAVAYMHSQKVVHRDIKPANIFLDLHCVLKLGDFGCSVRLRDQATVYGEIAEYAGTVQYMVRG
ncbi:hypothetical protein TELCIR_16037 [Teladorsagia circumcincta]|uniref:Protein kinase domain-containing protein n=1 Tax=Teladorsagia circumcincta TaxID=45464 RepID=A0A2G9TWK4_TELCI|nr:hypothetical protein TELCIR_16037 [Teladorsagia circumcincta]